MKKTLTTHWEFWVYDLWADGEGGFTVNDRTCIDGDYVIQAKVHPYNAGTPNEFHQANISDGQIRNAFGLAGEFSTDGDDVNIYIDDSDGNPLCEMNCTSHDSLVLDSKLMREVS